jgi:hypothetical protein
MIDFNKSNKTLVSLTNNTSTHRAIKKRRPNVQLTKQNNQFLRALGLLK